MLFTRPKENLILMGYDDIAKSFAKTLDRMGKGEGKMVTNNEDKLLSILLEGL